MSGGIKLKTKMTDKKAKIHPHPDPLPSREREGDLRATKAKVGVKEEGIKIKGQKLKTKDQRPK
ncbi:MAG: hypothetical protein MUO89_01090 [Dehalococcoidia bacterium]|nr:hypothetical protein [Dehalococcoidia bacterium]